MEGLLKDFVNPKTIAKLVVSGSVGLVVGNVIKATTPASLSLPVRLAVGLGSLVLSGMVGDLAADHVEREMGTLVLPEEKTEEDTIEDTTQEN